MARPLVSTLPQKQNPVALLCLLSCSASLAVRVITPGNLTVESGKSAVLSCELDDAAGTVDQVEWSICGKFRLLVFHKTSGQSVDKKYKNKITDVSISRFSIKRTTVNDSGEYCCMLTTYPHGSQEGRMVLAVHPPNDPPDGSSTTTVVVPVIGGVLALALLAGITVGVLHQRQKGSIRNPVHVVVHSGGLPNHKPSFLHRATTVRNSCNSQPGQKTQKDEIREENEEYFNVVSK